MDSSLRALHHKSAKFLLWAVFLRDNIRGLKLWLSTGFGISEMPLIMLFFGNDARLIPTAYVLERMKYSHENPMFLPELIETSHKVGEYSDICTDDFLRAIRIIRSHHILNEDKIDNAKASRKQLVSIEFRILAAILIDDQKWLGALMADPDFHTSGHFLDPAARYGSITCFRFLSINGAHYTQNTLEAAMYGGNEEIIQMCLEHGCNVDTSEMMKQSIRGCQTKVVEWLIDVHGMKPSATDVVIALMHGHYDFLVRSESALYESQTISFEYCDCDIIPRNKDLCHLVKHLLADPRVPEILKNRMMTMKEPILYCDNVTLANECRIDIACFDSIVTAASNDCTDLLKAVSHCIIDATNGYGDTILIECVHILSAVILLVENGADVNAKNSTGKTALMQAASKGHADIVRYLVEHGANVETVDINGFTALFFAAYKGRTNAVSTLVELGADINQQLNNGQTMLMFASWYGYIDTVEYLVNQGVNVNAAESNGMTSLMRAVWGGSLTTVEYLVGHGANIEAVDKSGQTALILAAYYGFTAIVSHLMEHGANIEAVDNLGKTALMKCAAHKQIETVKFLVGCGVAIDTPDQNGMTALMHAIYVTHDEDDYVYDVDFRTDIIKHLIESGAKIDVVDKYGRTPLILAAVSCTIETIQYLINHGANVNAVDLKGNNARKIASLYCRDDIVYYLDAHASGLNIA